MRFRRMTEVFARLVDNTITNTNKINDFSIGSAMRAIYEAIAIEIEQFYILTRENMREAIEDGVYEAFGFERKPAVKAFGLVNITFHNATQQELVVPRGSKFSSNQAEYTQIYETIREFRIPRGTVVAQVEVHCMVPGAIGNTPAHAINIMQSPVPNVKQVSNPQAFLTGVDEEPIEELRSRFKAFIDSRGRATIPALDYGTREVLEVSGVHIDEKIGKINIYAHDRNGNLSPTVQEKIRKSIEEYRPAGIPVEVSPVNRRTVDVNIEVTLTDRTAATNAFRDEIRTAVERYLNTLTTSQNLILSDLVRVIMNLDNIIIYDVKFTNLEDNIYVDGSEIIRAGTVNVTLN